MSFYAGVVCFSAFHSIGSICAILLAKSPVLILAVWISARVARQARPAFVLTANPYRNSIFLPCSVVQHHAQSTFRRCVSIFRL
jgi:hypothetical protein